MMSKIAIISITIPIRCKICVSQEMYMQVAYYTYVIEVRHIMCDLCVTFVQFTC